MGSHRFSAHPGQQQAGQASVGELVVAYSGHNELVRPVDAPVFFPVAGVGAWHLPHHQPRHEAQIGVRFAGPDKLVYLIESGEVVERLRRGFADRGHRPAQVGENFANGNQAVALTLHGFTFPQNPNSPEPNTTEGVSIDDYSTWRAVRFAKRDETG